MQNTNREFSFSKLNCLIGIFMSLMFSKLDIANAYIVPMELSMIICSGVYIKLS